MIVLVLKLVSSKSGISKNPSLSINLCKYHFSILLSCRNLSISNKSSLDNLESKVVLISNFFPEFVIISKAFKKLLKGNPQISLYLLSVALKSKPIQSAFLTISKNSFLSEFNPVK